ncbi:MAG: hypothetical protein WCK65_13140 [Rhodospirillaceae bacterium]
MDLASLTTLFERTFLGRLGRRYRAARVLNALLSIKAAMIGGVPVAATTVAGVVVNAGWVSTLLPMLGPWRSPLASAVRREHRGP